MDVTFYEVETGRITRYGSLNNPDDNVRDGEAFIEGIYRDSLFQIENGQPVNKIVTADDVEVVPYDVDMERDRRFDAGFDYDFGDARGVHHIGTSRDDMIGWDEVTVAAQAMLNISQGQQVISILTDTGPVDVTAEEWQLILIAAAAFRQPIWRASFALRAMSPIPVDYQDDRWWP